MPMPPFLSLPVPDIIMQPAPPVNTNTLPQVMTAAHAPSTPPGRINQPSPIQARTLPPITKLSSISDRLEEVANDNGNSEGRSLSHDPLKKYTNGPMPPIQDATPTSVFDYIDIGLVRKWEKQPGKLIVIPFDNEAQSVDAYESICNRILTSVAEITNSQDVSVTAPKQSAKAADKKWMPLSFLVYNLTKEQADTVLQCSVWSSRAITFHATCFGPTCPNFMFAISGLGTISVKAIYPIVKNVWESETTKDYTQSLADQAPEEEREQTRAELTHVLKSMSITRLDTKEAGNVLKPRFNVYTDSSNISYDVLWLRLCTYLCNKPYKTSMESCGTTDKPPFICSNCHGANHPRGLCPFPELMGWNGPPRDTGETPSHRIRGTPAPLKHYQNIRSNAHK
ncbi:hypothetical protein EDB89DRAFT_1901866 [Lactarius sanguifluus]|nr:hypothetical protein EDB89DRAFT_1901866 [Lactarius sanguifluus]